MSNIVRLDQYRSEAAAKAADLAAMSYDEACDWAGPDFDRLVAVAKARDYRPEWISYQLFNHGVVLPPDQAVTLSRMIDAAGEYLSRRQRWILRQLRTMPMQEKTLAKLAAGATEYRAYKHPERCLAHDLGKLVARGVIRVGAGAAYVIGANESGGAFGRTP